MAAVPFLSLFGVALGFSVRDDSKIAGEDYDGHQRREEE
jgi:hypothetical protein